MGNTNISPNMNLPVPVVGVDPGPDWANNINASLGIIDQHNHSLGEGVQINPGGININSSLNFNNNLATNLEGVSLANQAVQLPTSIPGTLYMFGQNLYWNDGTGSFQVQITNGVNVNAGAGSIGGLPSGTASVNYSAGTYTFLSATSTPGTISVGPIVTGTSTLNPYTITFSTASSQSTNYNLTWPAAAPAGGQILISDGSGNFTWSLNTIGRIPVGSVVATFPNLNGAYSTTATGSANNDGFVLCVGQTISDSTSPMNGDVIPNINSGVFLQGNSSAGGTGGADNVTLSTSNLPSHTHGAGSYATSLSGTFGSTAHEHYFGHYHQTLQGDNTQNLNAVSSSNVGTNTTTIGTGGSNQVLGTTFINNSGGVNGCTVPTANTSWYSTGVIGGPNGSGSSANTGGPTSTASLSGSNSVTGTSSAAGSGSSFSVVPNFINAVYLMRIK